MNLCKIPIITFALCTTISFRITTCKTLSSTHPFIHIVMTSVITLGQLSHDSRIRASKGEIFGRNRGFRERTYGSFISCRREEANDGQILYSYYLVLQGTFDDYLCMYE